MKRKRKGGRISQGQNGDPSRGDNPAQQIPTPKDLPLNEALQPKPRRGRCRADQGKERSTATIYVAIYNVRSLAHSDNLKRLQEQIFQDDKMPLSLKRQVFDQCVLPTMTYGCQTWSLTKATTQRLRTAQRAMERKMLKAKLKDKIPCREIRAKTNIKDVVKFAAKQKWKWAGHVARLNDNRWTKRITDWQPRYGKRSRGRQAKRWRDDIVQMKGITWGRDAGQRDDWRRDAEGYILQWMDGASV